MSGRIEQENKIKEKITSKLNTLPPIYTAFYNYMRADQKSYITIKHYIEHISEFMDAVTKGKCDNDFYKNVTVAQLREYIISLRTRFEKGKEVKNSDSIQAKKWSALNSFFNFYIYKGLKEEKRKGN